MKITKITEIFANAAIVVVAILFSIFMVQRYLGARAAKALRSEAVGKQIPTPLRRLNPSTGRELVIAIKSGCSYCEASLPFYRRLVSESDASASRVVVLMPDAQDIEDGYLSRAGLVATQHIADVPLASLHVNVTPTILLVDSNGLVLREWTGQLSKDEEIQVEQSLTGS